MGRTSQRFHVRLDRHVTKNLKKFIFDGKTRPKGENSFVQEHLLNNPNCAENYNDSRFKLISRVRNAYHLCILKSLFIKTLEPKLFKQRDHDVYNLNLYK